jgi:hypothetical protein
MTLAIVVGATLVAFGILGLIATELERRARERAIANGTLAAELGYCRAEVQAVALATAIRAGGAMASSELLEEVACHVIEDLDEGRLEVDELARILQRARVQEVE